MANYEEIDPVEAQRRLGELTPVDVRADHEYHGPLGHVPGAIQIALPELADRLDELPQGRRLLMICRSGKRSGTACELVHERTGAEAINLAGGMIAWNRARLPVAPWHPGSAAELLDGVAAWLAQVSSVTPGAARGILDERLACLGASPQAPSKAELARVVDFVEESLGQSVAPPDLDLTLAAFRAAVDALA